MTNLANKANIETALMNAMQPGLNTIREVDKVMARIRKGEFDVEEQVPELVIHARSILDDPTPHDQKSVEACKYIVNRWEQTKGRRDPITVGTRSDLDDANVPRNEAEVLHEMEKLVTELVEIKASERAQEDDVHEYPVLLHWAAFAEYSSMKLMDERHTASLVIVPDAQAAATNRGLFEFGADAFRR